MTYQQVMLDVDRCAGRLQGMRNVYFHRREDEEEDEDEEKDGDIVRNESASKEKDLQYHQQLKSNLADLIVKLLKDKQSLHYYQGFHDVCLTYMIMFGVDEAYQRLDKIIDSHFSTFMQPTMNEAQEFLALIPILLELHDNQLGKFFEIAEVGTIFALSWVITWFSHDIRNEDDVAEIFKFLQEQDPHFILYLCAEVVMLKRDELLKLEPEMSTVHHFLCQIPRKEKLPVSKLLKNAQESFSKWSPELLKQKLDHHRKSKLQLHNFNILTTITDRLGPTLSSFVTTNAKTAILVLVLASAIALQFERWSR